MKTSSLLLVAACAAGAAYTVRSMARRTRKLDWRGRVVIITGGSRGLGLVMARQLVAAGAKLAICARDERELSRAQHELTARGATVFSELCDVTRPSDIRDFVQSVRTRFGQVDVLINNAGVIQVGPCDVMETEDYEQAMATHFWGPLHFTLAVVPEMKARGEGRIINIASIGGKISVPHLLPYSASKFALAGLSSGLRTELAKHNILVTTVFPHLMRTGSHHNALFKGQHRAEFAWFSLGAALPLVSMSGDRAATTILDAAQHGDAEVTLTLQANLATRLFNLFPGSGATFLKAMNRFLPGAKDGNSATHPGQESYSWASPSIFTTLGDRAALRNNELS